MNFTLVFSVWGPHTPELLKHILSNVIHIDNLMFLSISRGMGQSLTRALGTILMLFIPCDIPSPCLGSRNLNMAENIADPRVYVVGDARATNYKPKCKVLARDLTLTVTLGVTRC